MPTTISQLLGLYPNCGNGPRQADRQPSVTKHSMSVTHYLTVVIKSSYRNMHMYHRINRYAFVIGNSMPVCMPSSPAVQCAAVQSPFCYVVVASGRLKLQYHLQHNRQKFAVPIPNSQLAKGRGTEPRACRCFMLLVVPVVVTQLCTPDLRMTL